MTPLDPPREYFEKVEGYDPCTCPCHEPGDKGYCDQCCGGSVAMREAMRARLAEVSAERDAARRERELVLHEVNAIAGNLINGAAPGRSAELLFNLIKSDDWKQWESDAETIANQQERAERLRAALEAWGVHSRMCARNIGSPIVLPDCDCGFAAALKDAGQ